MRIVIIDDEENMLQYCTLLLNGEPGIDVVGSFTSGEAAIAKLEALDPDIMLVDIGLPGISGIDVIEKAKLILPGLEMIVHTVYADRHHIFQALKKGAVGYILKGCRPKELIDAIFDIAEGGAPMSPQIARSIIKDIQKEHRDTSNALTARETQILEMMDRGCSYKGIAKDLCISPHTVHTHIKHIYEKLHAKDRREMFSKARKKGILY